MSRHQVGDRGVLAKPLATLCCSAILAPDTEVEIYHQHSPKRVWIQCLPEVPFLGAGHTLRPADGDMDRLKREMDAMPKSGPVGDLALLPKMAICHKVKLSGIWFRAL